LHLEADDYDHGLGLGGAEEWWVEALVEVVGVEFVEVLSEDDHDAQDLSHLLKIKKICLETASLSGKVYLFS